MLSEFQGLGALGVGFGVRGLGFTVGVGGLGFKGLFSL